LRSQTFSRTSIPFFLLLAVLLSSCGYHVARRSPALPSWIKSVYVEPFKNNSNELLLGAWITEALRDEILRSPRFTLTSKDKAQVIIRGKVEEVESEGLSYVRYYRSVERSVKVKVSFDLLDARTRQSLWGGGGELEREEAFLVGEDIMKTEGYKERALRKVSTDLAEILYHRLEGVY